MKTVTALYDTYSEASSAISELEAAGIPHSDISYIASESGELHPPSNTAADAGAMAGVGAAVGGVGGLLTGLGIMAIPGVGPVVAAGWLVATAVGAAAGAAVGGAAGGLVGALTNSGVPESDANVYAEAVRRGAALVSAKVDDARAAEVQLILQRQKHVDISRRGEEYRRSGWTTFNMNAPAYSPGEPMQERWRNR